MRKTAEQKFPVRSRVMNRTLQWHHEILVYTQANLLVYGRVGSWMSRQHFWSNYCLQRQRQRSLSLIACTCYSCLVRMLFNN